MTDPTHAVVIRPLVLGDLPSVEKLELLLFGPEAWPIWTFQRDLRVPARTCVVAEHAGEVVGYAALWRDQPTQASLANIGVHPDSQRQGIGRQLLEHLLRMADDEEIPEIELYVSAENLAAQRLYAQHGFRPVARRLRYYRHSGEDALIMRRPCTMR